MEWLGEQEGLSFSKFLSLQIRTTSKRRKTMSGDGGVQLTPSKGSSSLSKAHSSSSKMNRRRWTPSLLLNWAWSQRSRNTSSSLMARASISATEFQRVGTERRRTCAWRGGSWATHKLASSSQMVGLWKTFFERLVICRYHLALIFKLTNQEPNLLNGKTAKIDVVTTEDKIITKFPINLFNEIIVTSFSIFIFIHSGFHFFFINRLIKFLESIFVFVLLSACPSLSSSGKLTKNRLQNVSIWVVQHMNSTTMPSQQGWACARSNGHVLVIPWSSQWADPSPWPEWSYSPHYHIRLPKAVKHNTHKQAWQNWPLKPTLLSILKSRRHCTSFDTRYTPVWLFVSLIPRIRKDFEQFDKLTHLTKSRIKVWTAPSTARWTVMPRKEKMLGEVQPSMPMCSLPGYCWRMH